MTLLDEALVFEDTTPLERYLAAQRDMTAIGRFVQREAADLLPKQARYYRDLIPLERPQPGQQYGFEIDLDTCTGCKACVTACRSLNGLDEDESWRTVGLLHGADHLSTGTDVGHGVGHGVGQGVWHGGRQTVTTGCHHCVDPACLKGCPVDAYEKDPLTGIVKHLDDQCIGCGYCMLTCPYEVPRYSPARGVVRKCDMCSDRLAVGEAPACVQACPNGAITIALVDKAAIVARSGGTRLVPGAPSSSITAPTTVYLSSRPELAEMQPADRFRLRPSEAHPPLAVMLVLTQLSVGAFLVDLALRAGIGGSAGLGRAGGGRDLAAELRPANALVALLLGLVALGASILHLGRPQHFYRAVIGFRHSWLSREIVAFGAFATLAVGYAFALWHGSHALAAPAGLLVAVVGTIGVACSAKIYAVTERAWWHLRFSAVKFAATTAVCGLVTVLFTSGLAAAAIGRDVPARAAHALLHPIAIAVAIATAAKLLWELAFLRHLRDREVTDLKRTAMLLCGALRTMTAVRMASGAIGGIAIPLIVIALSGSDDATPPIVGCTALAGLALVLVIVGELIERHQFFRAVSAPRMPGELG